MNRNGNISQAWRKAFAVIVCSIVGSLATLLIIISLANDGLPISQDLHKYAISFMIVFPIAAAGITFFGLPLLYFVRLLGWISTARHLLAFGAIAGAMWGAIVCWFLLKMRVEDLLYFIPLGAVNGVIVAMLWLGIVYNFRLSQKI